MTEPNKMIRTRKTTAPSNAPKTIPTVPEAEWPYQVPENWRWVRLLDSFDNLTDSKRKIQQKSYLEYGNIAVVDQGQEIVGGYTNDERIRFTGNLPVIVFGDHTRCIKYVDFPFAQGADGVKVLAPRKCYYPKAFYYALINVDIPNMGYRRHYPLFKNYYIPLPPLAEQQRIVDRIERLFAKLDEAREKAQAVVDGFENRKAAILHQAFTGELTKKWREENNIKSDDYISSARAKRDKISQEKKVKKLKYSFPDDIILPNILDEWQYLQIGDVAWSIKDGPHYSPEYVDEGIPFITGGNVRPDGIDFFSAKKITKELHKELSKRCHPEKGDMLYTKGGTTGIARVNNYDFEFSVWVHVAVIKFVDIILPEYFQMVLNSPPCYEQSQKYTHGVGNQDLGLTRMINIVFPICSIAEQNEIIQEVGSMLDKERRARDLAESVIAQIDGMKKAILARAFRGELGTNDPSEAACVP